MNIANIIDLSNLLGEMGHVKRATRLPSKEYESDSHHSFSLALVAYHICQMECPELDVNKVVLFALTHDLLEIITGDEDTLHYTPEQLHAKHQREVTAVKEFDMVFSRFPDLKVAIHEYEKLDTPEAATVFVLDKACTTWTHHADKALYARTERNLRTADDIQAWAERQRAKFEKRLNAMPPEPILRIYEESFKALRDLYDK